MCMFGIHQYPSSVTSELLQPLRKRGRPKKAAKGGALRVD
jgi:hypothetical protein